MTAAESLALKDVWLCPWGVTEPKRVHVLREVLPPMMIVSHPDGEQMCHVGNLYPDAASADRVALGHVIAEIDRLARLLASARETYRLLRSRVDPEDDEDADEESTPLESEASPVGTLEAT